MTWRTALAAVAVMAVSAAQGAVTADSVLAQVQKNFASLRDYKVNVSVSVKSQQMHMTDQQATVYYKKPDKVRVIAKEGVGFFPKDLFTGDPVAGIKKDYKVSYAGNARVGGADAHLLKLTPKTSTAAGPMKVWVEKKRGLIVQTAMTIGGGTASSSWNYTFADGKYWVPTVVKMKMSGVKSPTAFDPKKMKVRPPASSGGEVTIKFSNYVINKGIPDSLFVESGKKK